MCRALSQGDRRSVAFGRTVIAASIEESSDAECLTASSVCSRIDGSDSNLVAGPATLIAAMAAPPAPNTAAAHELIPVS